MIYLLAHSLYLTLIIGQQIELKKQNDELEIAYRQHLTKTQQWEEN